MHATSTLTLTLTAFLSVVTAQDLVKVTIYTDDVCSSDPFTLTTNVAEDFCFANIGPRQSFGDLSLGINCDAGSAKITTYTDNACESSPSEFGPDFEACTPISFNSIKLSCQQINGRTAASNGTSSD